MVKLIIKDCGAEAVSKIETFITAWNNREIKAVERKKGIAPLTINMLKLERDGEHENNQYKGVIMITVPVGGADASVLATYYFDLNADGYKLYQTASNVVKGKKTADALMAAVQNIIFGDSPKEDKYQF